jgi:hypothetical protein
MNPNQAPSRRPHGIPPYPYAPPGHDFPVNTSEQHRNWQDSSFNAAQYGMPDMNRTYSPNLQHQTTQSSPMMPSSAENTRSVGHIHIGAGQYRPNTMPVVPVAPSQRIGLEGPSTAKEATAFQKLCMLHKPTIRSHLKQGYLVQEPSGKIHTAHPSIVHLSFFQWLNDYHELYVHETAQQAGSSSAHSRHHPQAAVHHAPSPTLMQHPSLQSPRYLAPSQASLSKAEVLPPSSAPEQSHSFKQASVAPVSESSKAHVSEPSAEHEITEGLQSMFDLNTVDPNAFIDENEFTGATTMRTDTEDIQDVDMHDTFSEFINDPKPEALMVKPDQQMASGNHASSTEYLEPKQQDHSSLATEPQTPGKRPVETENNLLTPHGSPNGSPETKRAKLDHDDSLSSRLPTQETPKARGLFPHEQAPQAQPGYGKKVVAVSVIHSKVRTHRLPNHGTISRRAKSIPEVPVTFAASAGADNKLIFYVVDGRNEIFGKLAPRTGSFFRRLMEEFPLDFVLSSLRGRLRPRDNDLGDLQAGAAYVALLEVDIYLNLKACVAPRALELTIKEMQSCSRPTDNKLAHFDVQHVQGESSEEFIDYSDYFIETLDENTDRIAELAMSFPMVDQHERIVTPLMPHQRQALWFMGQRELTPYYHDTDKRLCLWERCEIDSKPGFRHKIILGTTQFNIPEDVKGGVIADEMGLGKTLSLISLIVSTSEAAKNFGKRKQRAITENGERIKVTAATLVVVKTSILDSTWIAEIQRHVPDMRFAKFYGKDRPKNFGENEVILTTYETLSREYSTHLRNKGEPSPLFTHEFYRIILDESHFIKNNNTNAFKACVAVVAKRRWASTGTPLQNKLADLGSLMTFLKVPLLGKKSIFESQLAKPVMAGDIIAVRGTRLLLSCLTIRRMKDTIKSDQNRFQKSIQEVVVPFDPEDRVIYDAMFRTYRKAFDNAFPEINGPASIQNKQRLHIFAWLTKLRQFAAHKKEMMNPSDRIYYSKLKQGKRGVVEEPPSSDSDEDFEQQDEDYEASALRNFAFNKSFNEATCCDCSEPLLTISELEEALQEELDDDQRESFQIDGDSTLFCITNGCLQYRCKDCCIKFEDDLLLNNSFMCDYCERVHGIDKTEISLNQYQAYLDAEEAARKAGSNNLLEVYECPSAKVNYLLNELNRFRDWEMENPQEPPVKR